MRYGGIKYKIELARENFWFCVMNNHKRVFKFCEKYLPFNTLPF